MELTKKKINEWNKEFAHVSKSYIRAYASDYKTERGYYKHLKTKNEENERLHSQPFPIYIAVEVEWHKSSTWGWNPSVEMRWEDADGKWHYDNHAGGASGCGYDKHSAAVAEALNKHFKNLLYSVRNKRTKDKPYGISYYEDSFPSFEGGVGMSCYPRIFAWLGYEMKHTASGKTYDKWTIVKKSEKKRFANV